MFQKSLTSPIGRIALLDIARGLAIVAMTIFHFSWDLEFFGYARAGITSEFGWKLFARCIAASFLMIAGFSLMIAHVNGVRWASFWRRFGLVTGASIIISFSTYIATPERFVFFGILHQIAAASLIALLFVRLSALLTLSVGIAVLLLPNYFRHAVFFEPIFWWTGLAPYDPPSNDYVPIFPWTGFVLIGMALAKSALRYGVAHRLSLVQTEGNKIGKLLRFLGNHSLIYYLLHQPLLIALLSGFAFVIPPAPTDKSTLFISQCVTSCQSGRDEPFCIRFCGCVRAQLDEQSIFKNVLDGKIDVSIDQRVLDISSMCTQTSQE